jgi:hypothetical protein
MKRDDHSTGGVVHDQKEGYGKDDEWLVEEYLADEEVNEEYPADSEEDDDDTDDEYQATGEDDEATDGEWV